MKSWRTVEEEMSRTRDGFAFIDYRLADAVNRENVASVVRLLHLVQCWNKAPARWRLESDTYCKRKGKCAHH